MNTKYPVLVPSFTLFVNEFFGRWYQLQTVAGKVKKTAKEQAGLSLAENYRGAQFRRSGMQKIVYQSLPPYLG